MNIKQIDWQKTVGRKADLQKAIQFSCNGAGGFGRFFEIKDLKNQLYYFDGRTTNIYFSEKEYTRFLLLVQKKLESINFVKKTEKEILDICEETINRAKKLSKSVSFKINSGELLRIFKGFDEVWNRFYPVGWAFFFIVGFDSRIEEKLLKSGFDKNITKEIIKISAKPDRLTPVMEAEVEILKLAKVINKPDKAKKLAKKLSERFGWMSVYNTEDKERGADYYLEEAKKIILSRINIDEKLKLIEKDVKDNEKKFQNYIKRISNTLLIEQLKFLHLSGYLRDKREEARDRITILEKFTYNAIAKKLGLKINEVVYLTNNEIELSLGEKNDSNLKKITQKRMKNYIFTVENGKFSIIDEDKINSISKLFEIKEDIKEIKGQIAYKQKRKVRGNAKIVLSNKELEKVKKGDILIATMTKPDFLTAMKKAAAFITDEGGVTCHAAIVSREMNKPCIVGTKIATKVLKDGDLVEVDAEKGIVRILDSSEF